MPVRPSPHHIGAWIAGGIAREVWRRHKRKFGAVAAGTAAYESGTMLFPSRKRKRTSKEVQDSSGYIQLTNLGRTSTGRRIGRQKKINKMVEAQMLTTIDRFQYLNPMNGAYGRFFLNYFRDTNINKAYFPFYAFDLTSLRVNMADPNTNTMAYSRPFTRLTRIGATNEYAFDECFGLKADGSTAESKWQSERAPYLTDAPNAPYEKVFLEWADIRLAFWGAVTLPSSAEVMIVRFPECNRSPASLEYLGATAVTTYPLPPPASGNAAGVSDYVESQKFWTAVTDNIVGTSSNVRQQAADQSGMVVLWRKKIDFNPTSSYEMDTVGHQFTLKLFYNMNMLCDYRNAATYGNSGDGITNTNQMNQNVWVNDVGASDCRSVLRNKESRVFLIIKGLTTQPVADTTLPVESQLCLKNASFDILVRRKHCTI